MTKDNHIATKDEELIPEAGALQEWQAEIRLGIRTRYDFDALHASAAAEANARDWLFHPPTCNHYRRLAAEIILDAERVAA